MRIVWVPVLLLCSAVASAADKPAPPVAPCVALGAHELEGTVYVGTSESGPHGNQDVKPGERRHLRLFIRRGPEWLSPDACLEWSLDSTTAATLDPKTATLQVAPDAPDEAVVRVRATLRGTDQRISGLLRVYDPTRNPLAGTWHELPNPACHKAQGESDDGIRELEIVAGGAFSVTWHPFESYRDYWGRYEFDRKAGTVKFTIEDGNAVPKEFKGDGRFSIDGEGHVHFDGITFGKRDLPLFTSCGYLFAKDR